MVLLRRLVMILLLFLNGIWLKVMFWFFLMSVNMILFRLMVLDMVVMMLLFFVVLMMLVYVLNWLLLGVIMSV